MKKTVLSLQDQKRQQKFKKLFILQMAIRDFFRAQQFIDVLTPPLVENPGLEVHLQPFSVQGLGPHQKKEAFLHSSPEFHMKEVLSYGFENIFTLSYCFRNEPASTHHRDQFLMLEWYRQNRPYEVLIDDCENLITFCLDSLEKENIPINHIMREKMIVKTMQEVFDEFCQIDILSFESDQQFQSVIQQRWPEVPLPNQQLSFDDLFHLLFLNIIEPRLKKYPKLLIKEFPASQAALSTIKKNDPRVCERFEIYLQGIEICNAFNELCDLNEQRKRAQNEIQQKLSLYNIELPEPQLLYLALERGVNSPSCGIALGVERLLMGLTGEENPFWDEP